MLSARFSGQLFVAILLILAGAAGCSAPLGLNASQDGTTEAFGVEYGERVFERSVRRGTWMSLDVSPDGRSLIFDLLGDIYQLDIEGGKATPLLTGAFNEVMPRFSPSGDLIAFVSDRSGERHIHIYDVKTGDIRQVSTESNQNMYAPEWSSDGSYILATQFEEIGLGLNSGSVVRYSVDAGGQASILLDSGQLMGQYSGVAPLNDFSFYTSVVGGATNPYSADDPSVIYFYNAETDQLVPLETGYTHALKPLLSPSMDHLAFIGVEGEQSCIVLRTLATAEERVLTCDFRRTNLWRRSDSNDQVPNYSFTHDGGHIVYSHEGSIWKLDVLSGVITEISFQADVSLPMRPLGQFEYEIDLNDVSARSIRNPALSPDGDRVAFEAFGAIWLLDRYEAELPAQRLTELGEIAAQPSWSEDGELLSFVLWDDERGGAVALFNVQSGSRIVLSNDGQFYSDPLFLGSRNWVVTLRGDAQARKAYRPERRMLREVVAFDISTGDSVSLGEVSIEVMALSRLRRGRSDCEVSLYVRNFTPAPDSSELGKLWLFQGPDESCPPQIESSFSVTSGDIAVVNDVFFSNDSDDLYIQPPTGLLSVSAPAIETDENRILEIHLNVDHPSTRRYAPDIVFGRYEVSLGEAELIVVDGMDLKFFNLGNGEQTQIIGPRVSLERVPPTGVLVFLNARIITIEGDSVIERGDIVVEGGVIQHVGIAGSVEPATLRAAHVIDLDGKTLLPGYVDLHAHTRPVQRNGTIPRSEYAPYHSYLAYGVTTLREVGTASVYDADLLDAGVLLGPRFLAAPSLILNDPSYEGLERAVDRISACCSDQTIKNWGFGGRAMEAYASELQYDRGLTATNHLRDSSHAIGLITDGFAGVEHTIGTLPYEDDLVHFLAYSGVTYTPTLATGFYGTARLFYEAATLDQPKLDRFVPPSRRSWLMRPPIDALERSPYDTYTYIAENLRKVHDAGGRIGLGCHGDLWGLDCHIELWAIASGGFEPLDVLRIGTQNGADAIGRGDQLGSISVGKIADLQILDENPLEDIRNTTSVSMVMREGILYDAHTLEQIWPPEQPH